jgi:hypothetical protein
MRANRVVALLLPALAMSVGWGFRGEYGHEAGAMIPGALLALACALTSGRVDWWTRYAVLALSGAVGWAFGGQMSYGMLIGYTADSTLINVAYGFATLFVVGALWAGIGGGVLGLGLTLPRSAIERFTIPILTIGTVWTLLDLMGASDALSERWSFYDTDWISATSALAVAGLFALWKPDTRSACRLIASLAVGWLAGVIVLTGLLGLRMTPPRSDNWSGCVGLFAALCLALLQTRNRAALLLVYYGLLAGGIGFALGDFLNMLGRAGWGPIGANETLRRLDHWKWMEQSFGLIMGFGMALGVERLRRDRLTPPLEDENNGPLRFVAPFVLIVVLFWINVHKNIRGWLENKTLQEGLFGIGPQWYFLGLALSLAGMVAFGIYRHRTEPLALIPATAFGRGQFLFLLMLWMAVLASFLQALPNMKLPNTLFVHLTFWATALICSVLVFGLSHRTTERGAEVAPTDARWRPGREFVICGLLLPLFLWLLARISLATHTEPLAGSRQRFPASVESRS